MDQPLTSSDHLAFGGEIEAPADQEQRAGSEEDGEGASPRRPFICSALGREDRDLVRQESLAATCGLLTVGELQSKDLRVLLVVGLVLTAVYVVIGYAWLMGSDRWTFTNTVYFMVISLLTIGYGDIVVEDVRLARVTDALLILLGLAVLACWGTYASQAASSIRSKRVDRNPVPDFDVKHAVKRLRHGLRGRLLWLLVVIIIGIVGFMYGADETMTTSLYWVIVTASTIGYGDVVPKSDGMKWFTVVYATVSTVSMLETLRFVGAYPFLIWRLRAETRVFQQFRRRDNPDERDGVAALAETAVTEVLAIPPELRQGIVTRSDFTLTMLLLLDRISYKDYQQAARMFDNFATAPTAATSPEPRTFPLSAPAPK